MKVLVNLQFMYREYVRRSLCDGDRPSQNNTSIATNGLFSRQRVKIDNNVYYSKITQQ